MIMIDGKGDACDFENSSYRRIFYSQITDVKESQNCQKHYRFINPVNARQR